MSCYVDPIMRHGWRLGPNCHLVADTEEELHAMAASIGMKRSWHQPTPPHRLSHYDLTERRRKAAVAAGAIELTREGFVKRFLRKTGTD